LSSTTPARIRATLDDLNENPAHCDQKFLAGQWRSDGDEAGFLALQDKLKAQVKL
jgi:hypothetical protein